MGKQQRSMRTKELLLAAAARQFAERGFGRASLADISEAAGVTKGALFFHFPTKDDLADAVRLRGLDMLDRAISQQRAMEASRLQVVVDVTHALNQLLRDDLFLIASVRIAREQHSDSKAAEHDFHHLWLDRLWQLVDEARNDGELPATWFTSTRTVVTAAAFGAETLVWMGAARSDVAQWISHLWQLTDAGAAGRIRTTARPRSV